MILSTDYVFSLIFYFILNLFVYFTSWLQFRLSLLIPFPPHQQPPAPHLPIHCSFISVQKRAGLSWISIKHGISNFSKTKQLSMYWGSARWPSMRNRAGAIDLCICFYQLQDEASLITIGLLKSVCYPPPVLILTCVFIYLLILKLYYSFSCVGGFYAKLT